MRGNKAVRYLVYGLIIFVLMTLQASNVIAVFEINPDLILLLVILHSFHYGEWSGEIFGFAAGLAEDAMSGTLFGLNAFILTVIGFLTSLYKKYIFVSDVIAFLIYVVIATFLKYVFFVLFSWIFRQSEYLSWMILLKCLGEIVYNTLIGALFFYLSPLLYRKEQNPF